MRNDFVVYAVAVDPGRGPRDEVRSYFEVALCNPKYDKNVGTAIRGCHAFGASSIHIVGERYRRQMTDVSNGTKWIGTQHWAEGDTTKVLVAAELAGLETVAVEVVPFVEWLPAFEHPTRALYLFGPEDGSIPEDALDMCRRKVMIPQLYAKVCLNLASAVNVVLYDRMSKGMR